MKKKIIIYLLAFVAITLFISCNDNNVKLKYSAPEPSHVIEFISKNSIKALSIKQTSDFAIILFENEGEYGHYVLYKDQDNKLYSGSVKASGNPEENPVFIGGVAYGKIPFVTVIINDEEILEKARNMEVTFADGTVAKKVIYDKGTIILYDKKSEGHALYTKLVIYDKDMKKLYER
jgi:hypothetical protein